MMIRGRGHASRDHRASGRFTRIGVSVVGILALVAPSIIAAPQAGGYTANVVFNTPFDIVGTAVSTLSTADARDLRALADKDRDGAITAAEHGKVVADIVRLNTGRSAGRNLLDDQDPESRSLEVVFTNLIGQASSTQPITMKSTTSLRFAESDRDSHTYVHLGRAAQEGAWRLQAPAGYVFDGAKGLIDGVPLDGNCAYAGRFVHNPQDEAIEIRMKRAASACPVEAARAEVLAPGTLIATVALLAAALLQNLSREGNRKQ